MTDTASATMVGKHDPEGAANASPLQQNEVEEDFEAMEALASQLAPSLDNDREEAAAALKEALLKHAAGEDVAALRLAEKSRRLCVTPEAAALAAKLIKFGPGSVAESKVARVLRHSADDLYGTLGIDPSASFAGVSQAFRRHARDVHPDKNLARRAEEAFKRLANAHDVLSDPVRRRRYDADDAYAYSTATPPCPKTSKRRRADCASYLSDDAGDDSDAGRRAEGGHSSRPSFGRKWRAGGYARSGRTGSSGGCGGGNGAPSARGEAALLEKLVALHAQMEALRSQSEAELNRAYDAHLAEKTRLSGELTRLRKAVASHEEAQGEARREAEAAQAEARRAGEEVARLRSEVERLRHEAHERACPARAQP